MPGLTEAAGLTETAVMPGLTGHLKRIVRRIEIHIRLDRIRPVLRILFPEDRKLRRSRL